MLYLSEILHSFMICFLLLPILIRLSHLVGLIDRPDTRKVHRKPIPSVGGLAIGLTVITIGYIYSPLHMLAIQYLPLTLATGLLMSMGILDDRLNLNALLRLLVQLTCASVVTHFGIRLTSLHGLFGVLELSLSAQYILTVLILIGITNAFNLIDGIDGLAGSLALVNMVLLGILAWALKQTEWLFLVSPMGGALLAFLQFNWRPARLFMGDGGSMVLGFLTASIGIALLEGGYQDSVIFIPQTVVLITGSCIIPVFDALRVFSSRIARGNTPFMPDKNHLHHWLLRQHLSHTQVTVRLVCIHLFIIVSSLIASLWISIFAIVIIQFGAIFVYTLAIQLSYAFLRSYRLVKRLETSHLFEASTSKSI